MKSFMFLLLIISTSPFLRVSGQDSEPVKPSEENVDSLELEKTDQESKLFTFEINDLSTTSRYRYQTDRAGKRTHNRLQGKLNMDVSLFFFEDKVKIDLQGGTGNSFGGSWSNTGIGDTDQNFELNFRRLSMTLKPSDFFEVTAGSFAPAYGAGTERTYLDADGYIMGYRANVNIESTEIIITGGYLGDFQDPNVFERFDGMGDFTYFQAMIHQRISEILSASFDYSSIGENESVGNTNHLWRGALSLDVAPWTVFLDVLQTEFSYGNREGSSAEDDYSLFAFTGAKRLKNASFIGGRDALVSVSYLYRTEDPSQLDFPVDDKGFEGSSYRLNASLFDLLNSRGPGKWKLYTDWTQSLDDCDQWRCEIGVGWKF